MKFQIKSEFFYMFLFSYKKQIVDFLKRGGKRKYFNRNFITIKS